MLSSQHPRPTRRAVPRLFVVCADTAARYGIADYLKTSKRRLSICGGCGEVTHALAQCLEARPSVVLVDAEMDGGAGWRLLRELRRKSPGVACVARIGTTVGRSVLEACRAGTLALCTLADGPAEITEAIERALGGEAYLSPSAQRLVRSLDLVGALTSAPPPEAQLGARESEVFDLLGQGLGTDEIAQRMGISREGVQSHCAHIKTKLGLSTHAQLVARAASANGASH